MTLKLLCVLVHLAVCFWFPVDLNTALNSLAETPHVVQHDMGKSGFSGNFKIFNLKELHITLNFSKELWVYLLTRALNGGIFCRLKPVQIQEPKLMVSRD